MRLLALALASLQQDQLSQQQAHQAQQLTATLERIQAETNAKLDQLSRESGFVPSSFAEIGDTVSYESVTSRLDQLRSRTSSRLATVQQQLHALRVPYMPSSFVETKQNTHDEVDPSFEKLDARLDKLHEESKAKIDAFFKRPSSFVETSPRQWKPELPADPLGVFGTNGYTGPSSSHLEAILKANDARMAEEKKHLERELRETHERLRRGEKPPSSFAQLLEWQDDQTYNQFSDKIKDITEGTNTQLQDIRTSEERYARQEEQKFEDMGAHPTSFIEAHSNTVAENFNLLQHKVDALEKQNEASLASLPPLAPSIDAQPSSFLQQSDQELVQSFQGIRNSIDQVWADTNASMADVRQHMMLTGQLQPDSLLEAPTGHTVLHDLFSSAKANYATLEQTAGEQLRAIRTHQRQAQGSLAKPASSFLETQPSFASLKAQLKAIEAQSQKELAAFPVPEDHLRTAQ